MQVSVNFAWDSSPELDVTDYLLYENNVLVRTAASPLTTQLIITEVGNIWHVTAMSSSGKESQPSNRVMVPSVRPKAPLNFRMTDGGDFAAEDFEATAFTSG